MICRESRVPPSWLAIQVARRVLVGGVVSSSSHGGKSIVEICCVGLFYQSGLLDC